MRISIKNTPFCFVQFQKYFQKECINARKYDKSTKKPIYLNFFTRKSTYNIPIGVVILKPIRFFTFQYY